MPRVRLGVVLADEALLRAAHSNDPVEVVVLRSTFLNPPRAAAAKRLAERIHEEHPNAEIVPYAWHYLTFEATDKVEVGSNRSIDPQGQLYGHFRSTPPVEQAWEVSKICAEALGATRMIVRTPPSFSPGSVARMRMTKFIELHPTPKLIWEPEGLWSSAAAAAFGEPLGLEVLAAAFSLTGHVMDFEGANWLRVSGGKDGRLRSSHADVLLHGLAAMGLFDEDDEDDEELADEDEADEGDADGAEEAKSDGDEGDAGEAGEPEAEETVTILFDGAYAYANLRAFVRACELI